MKRQFQSGPQEVTAFCTNFRRNREMTGKLDLYKLCKWNVIVFIFYIFWYKYAYREIVNVIYITGIFAIACMAFDLLNNRSNIQHVFPSGVSVNLIMCVYSVITGIWAAVNYSALISEIKTYASYTLMCMAICYVTYYEKDPGWIAKTLVAVAALCCVQVFFKGYHLAFYGYVMGPDNNPNEFGLVLDLGIFGVLFTYPKKKKAGKIISILLMIAFVYFIVGCGSRKCLIAALILIIMWAFPMIKEKLLSGSNTDKVLILLSVIILIVAAVYYYQNVYVNTDSYNRMTILGDTSDESGSSAKRELYYRLAFEIFLNRPVFGAGFEQFRYYNQYGAFSHSTFAEAIASWGIIGCIIYFLPVVTIAIKLMRGRKKTKKPEMFLVLIALWVTEIFLGIGQIWFYSIEHLIAWTILYVVINKSDSKEETPKEKCKYVKA